VRQALAGEPSGVKTSSMATGWQMRGINIYAITQLLSETKVGMGLPRSIHMLVANRESPVTIGINNLTVNATILRIGRNG
jgi:hypothetical protein